MPRDQSLAASGFRRDLLDARARTLALVADLSDDRLMGPRLSLVNPMRWEIGHVAWFAERWILRHLRGEDPIREDADRLYDSMKVPHDVRWDLPLPSRRETLAYMDAVLDRVLGVLGDGPVPEDLAYFCRLATYHEDMHGEAFTTTRQTLGYPAPALPAGPDVPPGHATERPPAGPARRDTAAGAGPRRGDVRFEGGSFSLGAIPGLEPFVFDNEKWRHPVDVPAFAMARSPVTEAEFAAFVEDGGYRRRELWSPEGWAWRSEAEAGHPAYWRRADRGSWERREFDRWIPLRAHLPVIHVNAHEAEAWCRWAGRRLPTEAEWEFAASDGAPGGPGETAKARFPWGDDAPDPSRANLDGYRLGPVEAGALSAGDGRDGLGQMIGNVWEWTATPFARYPGFVPDPYKDYSEPWMDGRHRVLRGGAWTTRARLIRNTWRNFYLPERRDVLAGFRTCAL
jgi:iron(II)-dependent oxidoreductase